MLITCFFLDTKKTTNTRVRRSLISVSNKSLSIEDVRSEITKQFNKFKTASLCQPLEKVCVPGPPGKKGSKGSRGRRGAQGTKGKKGKQGIMGVPGSHGQQGIMGNQGEKGEKGEKGKITVKGSHEFLVMTCQGTFELMHRNCLFIRCSVRLFVSSLSLARFICLLLRSLTCS